MKKVFIKLEIEIVNYDVNKEHGFFHIEFTFEQETYFLQLCLGESKEGKFTKNITENGGYDDGICGDANKISFEKFGKEACLNLLLRELKTTV